MAYPQPPPGGFQQPPFPPYPQGQPMVMNIHGGGMHPPPMGVYSGYPNQQMPMGMGGPIPMMAPGSGGGAPQAFYAQQVPPTSFPMGGGGLGGGGFHNVPMDGASDYEAQKVPGDPGFEFTDKSIRRAFIRKVYSILCVQLLVTVAFIACFLYHPGLKMWTRQNRGFFYAALALTFVTMLAMACCESVRRKSPQNFICLSVFTLCEGFVLGTAASTYNQNTVLLAAAITAVVCGALTLFSFQTKWDFTAHGGILFVAGIVLFIFGIVMVFLRSQFPILHLVYACIGALIFSAYLVYDTQLMMGGTHKCSISPEEYIFAALNLYMDIINIFIYMLTILSAARGGD